MRYIDSVKSAGNKHLWVFYAQAVGSCGVLGCVVYRSRGNIGRKKTGVCVFAHFLMCIRDIKSMARISLAVTRFFSS